MNDQVKQLVLEGLGERSAELIKCSDWTWNGVGNAIMHPKDAYNSFVTSERQRQIKKMLPWLVAGGAGLFGLGMLAGGNRNSHQSEVQPQAAAPRPRGQFAIPKVEMTG